MLHTNSWAVYTDIPASRAQTRYMLPVASSPIQNPPAILVKSCPFSSTTGVFEPPQRALSNGTIAVQIRRHPITGYICPLPKPIQITPAISANYCQFPSSIGVFELS